MLVDESWPHALPPGIIMPREVPRGCFLVGGAVGLGGGRRAEETALVEGDGELVDAPAGVGDGGGEAGGGGVVGGWGLAVARIGGAVSGAEDVVGGGVVVEEDADEVLAGADEGRGARRVVREEGAEGVGRGRAVGDARAEAEPSRGAADVGDEEGLGLGDGLWRRAGTVCAEGVDEAREARVVEGRRRDVAEARVRCGEVARGESGPRGPDVRGVGAAGVARGDAEGEAAEARDDGLGARLRREVREV